MNKKICSFVGSIMGIVASSISIICYGFMLIIMSMLLNLSATLINGADYASELALLDTMGTVAVWVLIIALVAAGATLACNIVILKTSKTADEEYLTNMTSIILNIILQAIVGGLAVWLLGVIGILLLLIFITVDTLYIIDLCIVSKRTPPDKVQQFRRQKNTINFMPENNNTTDTRYTNVQVANNQQTQQAQNEKSIFDKAKELEKLAELKDKKIITDEEFAELKKNILQ